MPFSPRREVIRGNRKVYRKSIKGQTSAHLYHLELTTGLKDDYLKGLSAGRDKARRRNARGRRPYASAPEFVEA
jgi:hypothetical protein